MNTQRILVEANHISKNHYTAIGAVKALDDVSVQVRAGEMVALVGPTGSGKTTLLGLLAGLDSADAGTVHLQGSDLAEMSADGVTDLRSQAVGFIYQTYNLFPGFTVRENIGLPLRLMFRPPFDAHGRSGQLLDELGLEDLAERYPPELSGGQQQMVAIARAMAANPPLILADEPTANLDSKAARQIVSRLRALADSGDHGVLIATHDLRTASQADRVLDLRDGRIVQEAELHMERPAQAVLAELV